MMVSAMLKLFPSILHKTQSAINYSHYDSRFGYEKFRFSRRRMEPEEEQTRNVTSSRPCLSRPRKRPSVC